MKQDIQKMTSLDSFIKLAFKTWSLVSKISSMNKYNETIICSLANDPESIDTQCNVKVTLIKKNHYNISDILPWPNCPLNFKLLGLRQHSMGVFFGSLSILPTSSVEIHPVVFA